MPPHWLIQLAVASVWLYEGVWCKLLRGQPHEFEVVAAVPYFGPRIGTSFLITLGGFEAALGGWVLMGAAPFACALAQTILLIALNLSGLIWARHILPDPGGMIVKNFAFLVLAWVSAGLSN